MDPGHVFVVRGRLEAIDADAVIVPTDANFKLEAKWDGLWGRPTQSPRIAMPTGWSRGSTEPSADPSRSRSPDLWFIDAAVNSGETKSRVLDKIVTGVHKYIASYAGNASARRSKPLVALPTLGVGEGGLDSVRGELIERLLSAAEQAARAYEVDVAIVAFKATDHAAFQHFRRQRPTFLTERLDKAARGLAAKASTGQIALFVGAGVSMSAGLPSWNDLLEGLKSLLPKQIASTDLGPLDIAELLSREVRGFDAALRKALKDPQRPGLSHLLLAGLHCEEAVTTNFDLLYERAAQGDSRALAVLPWDPLNSRRHWLLKMHGDINHDKSIVLSRGDFIRYGREHGPAGAVLQSLLLSRHLLVVGASLTDDNFLRLAYEVHDFVKERQAKPRKLGTVLTLEPQPVKKRLFRGVFDYVSTGTSTSSDNLIKGRSLAIFLDALGMYASVDSSYLLDPRYSSLLDKVDADLAQQINGLLEHIGSPHESNAEGWANLAAALEKFGAKVR